MIYLLDTHILLWSFFEPEKINGKIEEILEDDESDVCASQISIWEISIKYSIGKLKLGNLKPDELEPEIDDNNYRIIPIKTGDLFDFYKLPIKEHKDPFDRMIIWQCIKNGYTLLSRDTKFDEYKKYGLKYIK
jgi:PIN domain nuclease of toxin-antitoxin system